MVAVPAHHVRHVAVYPFLKEIVSAVKTGGAFVPTLYPFAFRKFPFIACLIHYEQTDAVGNVIHHRSLWVMTHAEGVYTEILQVAQTAFPHLFRHNGTERAGIMMDADSLNLHILPIEGKTGIGIESESAYAYGYI